MSAVWGLGLRVWGSSLGTWPPNIASSLVEFGAKVLWYSVEDLGHRVWVQDVGFTVRVGFKRPHPTWKGERRGVVDSVREHTRRPYSV